MKTTDLLWEKDGLPVIVKRSRVEDKYRTLLNYMRLFSTGMKNRWARVYVDLYSGGGAVSLEGDDRIYKGSSLLALDVPDKFDKYIFCEESKKLCDALEQRIKTNYADTNYTIIQGDCNQNIARILNEVPKKINGRPVLTLCMVDPNSLEVKLGTIQKVASIGKVDFIVLMALMMDANRNLQNYLNPENKKIEEFLTNPEWRAEWLEFKTKDDSFPRFLIESFENKMKGFGYELANENIPKREVRSRKRNLPLYHLAFFSKDLLGFKFWGNAIKYSTTQGSFEL
ncbi:MAG: three-Cys-motif partner protein TcmP [Ignavibacteriales bacterium]|nr:three-Cys-motif partner protein TcmP [Ignavibacteriales bacterium]